MGSWKKCNRRRLGDRGLKGFPSILGDFSLAFNCWVDSVGLVESFGAADTIEEVGDKAGLEFLGGFGEDGLKAGGEFGAHVIGHLQAGE